MHPQSWVAWDEIMNGRWLWRVAYSLLVAVQSMILMFFRQQDVDNETASDNGNTENIYVTIDDVISIDDSHQEETPTSKLTRTQNRVLQVMDWALRTGSVCFSPQIYEIYLFEIAFSSQIWDLSFQNVISPLNHRRDSFLMATLACLFLYSSSWFCFWQTFEHGPPEI